MSERSIEYRENSLRVKARNTAITQSSYGDLTTVCDGKRREKKLMSTTERKNGREKTKNERNEGKNNETKPMESGWVVLGVCR